MSRLYEQIFAQRLPNGSGIGDGKISNFYKLLNYEHIIYHFKVRDLEIPLI